MEGESAGTPLDGLVDRIAFGDTRVISEKCPYDANRDMVTGVYSSGAWVTTNSGSMP